MYCSVALSLSLEHLLYGLNVFWPLEHKMYCSVALSLSLEHLVYGLNVCWPLDTKIHCSIALSLGLEHSLYGLSVCWPSVGLRDTNFVDQSIAIRLSVRTHSGKRGYTQ